MPNLIFLHNVKQLAYVKKFHPAYLDSHIIIAVSTFFALELNREGRGFEFASAYLSTEDLKNIVKEASVLSKGWYKLFEDSLNYRGINLGDLCSLDILEFFRDLLASNIIIERIIEKYHPEEAVIFGNPASYYTLRFPERIDNDVFEAVAIYLFEKKDILIHKLFLKEQPKRISEVLFAAFKRIFKGYLGVNNFRFFGLKESLDANCKPLKEFRRNKENLLVAIYNDQYFFMLRPLVKALSKLETLQTIILKHSRYLKGALSRAELKENQNLQFFSFDEARRPFMNKKIVPLVEEARRRFEIVQRTDNSVFAPVLKNPYLGFQFDYIWNDCFLTAVNNIDFYIWLFENLKPNLIMMLTSFLPSEEKTIANLSARYGVLSIAVPHGWLADLEMQDSESDIFLAWGELSREQLIKESIRTPESIVVVGTEHYNNIALSLNKCSQDNIKKAKSRFGLRPESLVVLILSSGFGEGPFSMIDIEKFFELFKEIGLFITQHLEIDFIIKAHPTSDCLEWYKHIINSFKQTNVIMAENTKIEHILSMADVTVLLGVGTTAGYLSLLAKKPLLVVKSFIKEAFSSIEAWNEENGLLVARENRDFAPLLETILLDVNARNVCLRNEMKFLQRSWETGKASGRIITLIDSLIKNNRKEAINNKVI